MRKTKIVCTLGPATDSFETVKRLIKAGMNVARLNMSHGDHDEHRERIALVKRAREEMNLPVAIMLDSKGPEIRIKTFAEKSVILEKGNKFTLTTEDVEGSVERVAITYKPLPKKLKKGDSVLINDGLIELEVDEVAGSEIICKVIEGGELSARKSINLPGTDIDMPYMSEVDKNDFLFGIAEDVDYFALSFVRTPEDVKIVKKLLKDNNAENIELIAKIENRQGVNNVSAIVDECDGAMVARGDLGVEIPFEELPRVQKHMIKLCYKQGKKVITATQMLESMINSPRPTRAEISDVANAIYDGTSAIMLSGETAVGKYPVVAVKTMAKIAVEAENGIGYEKRFYELKPQIESITDAVSHSTVSAAYDLGAKAIIAVSKSGRTVRKVSRFRPLCPIIGSTTSQKAYNQLAMNWGVTPLISVEQSNSDELFEYSIESAKKSGLVKNNDLVVIVAGVPIGESGTTNTMRITKV